MRRFEPFAWRRSVRAERIRRRPGIVVLAALCAVWAGGLVWAEPPPAATPVGSVPEFELGGMIEATTIQAADRVVVRKAERRLQLFAGAAVLGDYEISLGRNPEGPKRALGDGRTPEGRYRIDFRKPDSDYYRALHISYPSARDRQRAAALGVEPGGAIMIHGLPNGLGVIGPAHRLVDWTDGCIALTNEEMDELWAMVPDGIPIEILP